MPVPSESSVRAVLDPYADDLFAVVRAGWAEWLALPAAARAVLADARTRANVVWAFMVAEAKARFHDRPGVVIREGNNTVTFLVHSQVLCRFKKLDEDGRSANYPTLFALQYNTQTELAGMPEAARVDVGYVLNPLGTAVVHVMVACRDGDEVAWSYALRPAGPALAGNDAAPAPTAPPGDAVERGPSRVRPRGPAPVPADRPADRPAADASASPLPAAPGSPGASPAARPRVVKTGTDADPV